MLGITEIFIALVVCLLILQLLKLQWMRTQLPPGPVPLPIIGNLWLLDFKLRRETLSKLTNIYGNIYTLWMGQTPLVVLNGYKAVKDGIITHSEEVSGRPLTPFYRDMMGEKGIRCYTRLRQEQGLKKEEVFLCTPISYCCSRA
uniref:Uncharacterized protein n=1 Tax=Corvus moneduloides TaxID=1196302 RepID=A0A8U7MCF5_CORMO